MERAAVRSARSARVSRRVLTFWRHFGNFMEAPSGLLHQ